jgi:hypothetical protein
MDPSTLALYADIVDILVKIALLIGSAGALYKFVQFRELKQRIQLDIEAKIYKLSSPETAEPYTWDKEGERRREPAQPQTHAVEILLTFTNKGFRRLRLYNVQVAVNTMRPQGEAQFDEADGHLRLKRVFTSGNIVPEFEVPPRPLAETSFYFIEPSVEQTISYLTLIPEPRELVQVVAEFNFEQKRIFPEKKVGETGLYPHRAARTYNLDSSGSMVD